MKEQNDKTKIKQIAINCCERCLSLIDINLPVMFLCDNQNCVFFEKDAEHVINAFAALGWIGNGYMTLRENKRYESACARQHAQIIAASFNNPRPIMEYDDKTNTWSKA
jgi:hypothetical protein